MKINEALQLIKFHYSNYKHNKRPRVKVLDYEYPGIKGQKTYGKRNDLLGWNINYFKNKKYARKAVDEIDSFARMLGAENEEKYKRIKYFFPEQAKFIRRYMRKHIKGLKRKDKWRWKNTDYSELIRMNRTSY
tara:strand:+ start:4584 stop:4982 length:399 start_codon:yes stop_codon:yes gene_type:complete